MAITKVTSSVLDVDIPAFKSFGTSSIMIGDTTTGTIDAANYNTGIGVDVFASLTSGDLNTAVGYQALSGNTTGGTQTAIGSRTLVNSTGNDNTAVGDYSQNSTTTGGQNVSVGKQSLSSNTTASNNTAIGHSAMHLNTTGYTNTCIGALAGDNITTGYGHTMVGYAVDPAYASGSSGELGFGREMITNGSGYFTVGVGTNKGYYNYGSTNGFTAGSDERLKEEIENSTVGLSFINDLTLRTFKWRKKKNIDPALEAYVPEGEEGAEERHLNKEETQLGMIAQEVKTVIDNHPEIPAGFAGHMVDVKGTECLDYVPFIQPLLKAVQELSAKNDALEARIAALEI